MDKTCMKCGKKNLSWNKKHFDKTGKWKLIDHMNDKNEWCVRTEKEKEKYNTRTKHDVELCPYCSDSSFGLFVKSENKLSNHIKIYHYTKGERLTDLDYKMSMGMSPRYLKYWTSNPSFHRYKHLYKA